MLYVFFIFFILLNMFLAIMNDAYAEVKADMSRKQHEFEMIDFFKKVGHLPVSTTMDHELSGHLFCAFAAA